MNPRWIPLFVLGLATGTGACRSNDAKLARREVPGAIVQARADLAQGRTEEALELMRAAANTPDLETSQRDEVQGLLEQAAGKRVEELSTGNPDPEELADLVELDLPRQIAVQAGLRAAQLWFADGEALDAYDILKRLDTKFPLHHERAAAGDLLVEIGLWLTVHGTGWFGIGHSTDDAQEVLEYAVLKHPSAARNDEAYETLARIYEDDRDLELAIERLELLVLHHPNSARRVAAQARIPHLRLVALRSPEYDRSQLLAARRELETWLGTHAGHELEREVRVDLGDCLRRMAESDVLIADFYERVGNPHGERYHLERAARSAREAGDEPRARAIEARAGKLPELPAEARP